MFRKLMVISMAVAAVTVLGSARAAADSQPTVFTAKGPDGAQVWVSTDLTRQRLTESYVPIVVAVRAGQGNLATLTRSTFTLIGSDGRGEPMADLETLRANYQKDLFDLTAVRLYGFPFGTLLDVGHVQPSEFFPVPGAGTGVRWDTVVLRPFDWTVDILYFKRPAGMAEGQEMTLKIAPKEWETPISVHFVVK